MKYYLDTEFIERGASHPIELISLALVREDGVTFYRELMDGWHPENANDWVRANVLPHLRGGYPTRETRVRTAEQVKLFLADDTSKPEFWGYYCDYDWVVFCQLFGTMAELPKGLPMFCRDVKQLCCDLGNPDLNTLAPPEGNVHNALDDALRIKRMHEALVQLRDNRERKYTLDALDPPREAQ